MLKIMAQTFKNDNYVCLIEITTNSKVNPEINNEQNIIYMSKILNSLAKTFYGLINEVEVKSFDSKYINSLITFGY